jgi:PhzF family phenazine biosynthesis protein
MAFAGHPTLGSAHVVRELFNLGAAITLKMKAGIIPVEANGDSWTFTANTPRHRDFAMPRNELSAILGLNAEDILDGAAWVDTGSEQLIVPLANADAVRRTQPIADRLAKISSAAGRSMACVFAPNGERKLLSRFFFFKHGSVVEDPGTGSATANLGGWFLSRNAPLPIKLAIDQGDATNRPCRIGLSVDAAKKIRVSGRVIEIGRGVVSLP